MSEPTCDECGARMYYLVDGVMMSLEQVLALGTAPKKIERRMPHLVTCSNNPLRYVLPRREHP